MNMGFEKIRDLDDEKFRRLTGIKKNTFSEMIKILEEAEHKKRRLGGCQSKVSLENQLFMALEYLREYRTYFHISQSYNLSESACYRIIKWVEDTLIKSRKFSLPGRKELLKSDNDIEVILIDATESPIERPKKNKDTIIQEKRKNTQ